MMAFPPNWVHRGALVSKPIAETTKRLSLTKSMIWRLQKAKTVEITLDKNKKKVILYTPQNRKLKARIVRASQCSRTALARNDNR